MSELDKMGKMTEQDRQLIMGLYEKGLVSGKTVLEKLGFNFDQEVEAKKTEVVSYSIDNDSEWQKLRKDNLKIGNDEFAIRAKQKQAELVSNKVEQARRNVEVLLKAVQVFETYGYKEMQNSVKASIQSNIKIMDTVSLMKA